MGYFPNVLKSLRIKADYLNNKWLKTGIVRARVDIVAPVQLQ